MSSPTDEQIAKVKDNLKNMIDFNNQIYTEGNTEILNAFLLLTLTDNKDLGLEIGLNLLKGCFIALGNVSAAATIFANFLCGVVNNYSSNTPPSLNQQFSNLLLRWQATSEQLTSDLEMYYEDPVSHWDDIFSGSVTNAFGTYTIYCVFSNLSTSDFPAETDTLFMNYMYPCQYALDQQIWFTLLPNFVITKFYPSTSYPCTEANQQQEQQQLETNAEFFYSKNPSYWNNWVFVPYFNNKGKDESYYEEWQNNIGTGAGSFSDGHLNDAACQYLFIDSYDDVIINPNGLFHRSFVFNNIPEINHTTHTYQH